MFAQAGRVLAGALIAGAKGRRQEEPCGGSGLLPRLGGHGRAPGAHGAGAWQGLQEGAGGTAGGLQADPSLRWALVLGTVPWALPQRGGERRGWVGSGHLHGQRLPWLRAGKGQGWQSPWGGALLGPTPGTCGARARGQSELMAGGGSSLSLRPFLLPQACARVPRGWPPARQAPAQPCARWALQLPAPCPRSVFAQLIIPVSA